MKVVILGAGAHAGVILDILKQNNEIEVVGFTDLDTNKKEFHGIPILGSDAIVKELKQQGIEGAIVGLGSKSINVRIRLFDEIKKNNLKPINAIHPKSIISNSVQLGEGVAIMAGSIINPYTKIKDNVVVNTGVIIDHDNWIEDHVFINPGVRLAGNVRVGEGTMIGIGASVLEEVKIGKHCRIGAGSVVLEDIPDSTTVVGVPAKKIK